MRNTCDNDHVKLKTFDRGHSAELNTLTVESYALVSSQVLNLVPRIAQSRTDPTQIGIRSVDNTDTSRAI